jgi:hypothetical protein
MLRKIVYLLTVIVWLATAAFAQDVPGDVHVKLSLADNKTAYRIGEPIKLVLEFTADCEGYQVDTYGDGDALPTDNIVVSPDSGVAHWLEEFRSGRYFMRDVISTAPLSANPTRIELLLNTTLRFDRPGRYSVKVVTRRVTTVSQPRVYRPPTPYSTNEISFEIQPMSEADEEKEVQRLAAALDATRKWQAEEKLTEELSFLTGDPSTREKVKRFLYAEGRSGNYFQHITYGLYIARNRALVFQLLETAMRDANLPVTTSLLSAVTKLRLLRESAGLPQKPLVGGAVLDPAGDPRFNAIQDAYVSELAAGLAKRTGKSQTTTAMTILICLPKAADTTALILREVRRLLLQQFEDLNPYEKEYLLSTYWDYVRDPSLLPALKRMLKSQDAASKGLHATALKRLIELAPDEARPFVVAEILAPTSLVDFDILKSLTDSSLPEIDAPLLAQIRQLASLPRSFDTVFLRHKTSLAARYATVAIYSDLMELYQQDGVSWRPEAKAGLLAYFARYNEKEALPLIELALVGLEPGQDFNLLPDLTRLYYSDGIDALLRRRLEGDDPRAASTAAYLLGLHGPPSDKEIIEARLERWRREWGNRAAEAQNNLQGTVERELIWALTRSKSWKLSPERIKELEQGCVTDLCRQNFPK